MTSSLRKLQALTERYPNLWETVHRLVLGIIGGGALFGSVVGLVSRTSYVYWINDALSNGHGPYEISLLIVIGGVALYYARDIWKFIKQAFVADSITFLDISALALAVFGIAPWKSVSASLVEWPRLSNIVPPVQIVAWSSTVWVVVRLYTIYRLSHRKEPKPQKNLLSDAAATEDRLGRANIVNQLVSVLRDYRAEGSFVVALTGAWGDGKTSVINFVRQKLKDEKFIFVSFSPWYFSSGKRQSLNTVLARFFDTLEGVLQKRLFRPRVAQALNQYYKLIEPSLKETPINFGVLLETNSNDLEKTKESLNESFSKLDARIVVVIDDLDRMSGKEIAFVFKLVHLCADFENVIYILAFDRQFIEKQLSRVFGKHGRDYADKIIQLELPLPQIPSYVLWGRFLEYIADIEAEFDIPLLKERDFKVMLEATMEPLLELLGNLRLIKLLMKRFRFALQPVIGEVNYFDLLILEVIRLKHPAFYMAILDNSEFFLGAQQAEWRLLDSKEKESSKDHPNELIYEKLYMMLPEELRHPIWKLLQSLFFSQVRYSRLSVMSGVAIEKMAFVAKSIAHPDYFYRYFHFVISSEDIPTVEWGKLLRQIHDTEEVSDVRRIVALHLKSAILQGKHQQWLRMMSKTFHVIKQDRLPGVLLALADCAVDFPASRERQGRSFSEPQLTDMFTALLRALLPEHIENVVLDVMKTCPDFNYVLFFIRLFDPSSEQIPPFPRVDYGKLKLVGRERLQREYIQENKNLFEGLQPSGVVSALKYFLDAEEYKKYIMSWLAKNMRYALSFLKAAYTDGFLDVEAITDVIEPARLLETINTVKQMPLVQADEAQITSTVAETLDRSRLAILLPSEEAFISTLRLAVEQEKKGQRVPYLAVSLYA